MTAALQVDLIAREYVVINHYGDRSGNIGAYGPFPSVQAANDAIEHLVELVGDSWEVVPLRRVHHEPEATQ